PCYYRGMSTAWVGLLCSHKIGPGSGRRESLPATPFDDEPGPAAAPVDGADPDPVGARGRFRNRDESMIRAPAVIIEVPAAIRRGDEEQRVAIAFRAERERGCDPGDAEVRLPAETALSGSGRAGSEGDGSTRDRLRPVGGGGCLREVDQCPARPGFGTGRSHRTSRQEQNQSRQSPQHVL